MVKVATGRKGTRKAVLQSALHWEAKPETKDPPKGHPTRQPARTRPRMRVETSHRTLKRQKRRRRWLKMGKKNGRMSGAMVPWSADRRQRREIRGLSRISGRTPPTTEPRDLGCNRDLWRGGRHHIGPTRRSGTARSRRPIVGRALVKVNDEVRRILRCRGWPPSTASRAERIRQIEGCAMKKMRQGVGRKMAECGGPECTNDSSHEQAALTGLVLYFWRERASTRTRATP